MVTVRNSDTGARILRELRLSRLWRRSLYNCVFASQSPRRHVAIYGPTISTSAYPVSPPEASESIFFVQDQRCLSTSARRALSASWMTFIGAISHVEEQTEYRKWAIIHSVIHLLRFLPISAGSTPRRVTYLHIQHPAGSAQLYILYGHVELKMMSEPALPKAGRYTPPYSLCEYMADGLCYVRTYLLVNVIETFSLLHPLSPASLLYIPRSPPI